MRISADRESPMINFHNACSRFMIARYSAQQKSQSYFR
jgi:hypothetical protein